MVADLQRVVRVHAAVEARWRAQDGLFGDVAVAADVDCYRGGGRGGSSSGCCCCGIVCGLRTRGGGAVEVAANDGVRLYDGFSAEDDTLCSVDLGAAGDFVSRVLVRLISLSIC